MVPSRIGYDVAARPANQLLLEEAYRAVTIREGDQLIELPAIQAVFRAMGVSAMKGNRGAQQLITQMVHEVEEADRKTRQELFEEAVIYKRDAEREIARCRALGIEPPEMVPHPDDICINPRTGEVRFTGPFSPDEKVELDRVLQLRDEAAGDAATFARRHARARDAGEKKDLLAEWHREQCLFDVLNDRVPKRYQAELEHRSHAAGAPQPGQTEGWFRDREKARKKGKA